MIVPGPIEAVLLDMDGVLFHGGRALPGAATFLADLAKVPHVFVTNNPTRSPATLVAHFRQLGLPAPQEQRIVTTAEATAAWLANESPGYRFFAVGSDNLHRVLATTGTADEINADFVVVGEGPGLDFDRLTAGINLVLRRGARLVCTNPDNNVDADVDGEHLVLAGGGALVAPFAVATGCEPIFIGKPHPLLFRMALDRIGVDPGRAVMIGDRPDTDIAGAAAIGLHTALVRSGRFAPGAELPAGIMPNWDVEDLDALRRAWMS